MIKLVQWVTLLLVMVIIWGAAYTDNILPEFRMEILWTPVMTGWEGVMTGWEGVD